MSNIKLTFQGEVRPEGLHIFRRKDFDKDLQNFMGKQVSITIQLRRKHRSLNQNAYLFGVVVPLVKDALNNTGYRVDLEQTHEFLKSQFANHELINEKTGEVLKTIGSTARMTTVEFMEYIESIQQWSAEYLNLVIPDPGSQSSLEFNK